MAAERTRFRAWSGGSRRAYAQWRRFHLWMKDLVTWLRSKLQLWLGACLHVVELHLNSRKLTIGEGGGLRCPRHLLRGEGSEADRCLGGASRCPPPRENRSRIGGVVPMFPPARPIAHAAFRLRGGKKEPRRRTLHKSNPRPLRGLLCS